MKSLFTFVLSLFLISPLLISSQAIATDISIALSLGPDVEILKDEALDHMSETISTFEGETMVKAPGIEQIGADSSIKSVLNESLEIYNSKEAVQFIDDVNKYYGIAEPVFTMLCGCACGCTD